MCGGGRVWVYPMVLAVRFGWLSICMCRPILVYLDHTTLVLLWGRGRETLICILEALGYAPWDTLLNAPWHALEGRCVGGALVDDDVLEDALDNDNGDALGGCASGYAAMSMETRMVWNILCEVARPYFQVLCIYLVSGVLILILKVSFLLNCILRFLKL